MQNSNYESLEEKKKTFFKAYKTSGTQQSGPGHEQREWNNTAQYIIYTRFIRMPITNRVLSGL
jgi:hypothetical protein